MIEDILQRLYARRRFGMRPGLERMLGLMERLNHPEQALAAVHVAGTNGKGSVAAMIESVLRAAGMTAGLFTSPHLLRFNERIRIGGLPVGEDLLAEVLRDVEAAAESLDPDVCEAPTFFECAAAAAFEIFRRSEVRLVVVETGLGGRLDATNVLTPLLSVITRIGLEHCEYLGNTLEQVAGEKAGIVKSGRPVIVGDMPSEATARIREVADRLKAPITEAGAVVSVTRLKNDLSGLKIQVSSPQHELGALTLGVNGLYQIENVATAVAALETLEQVLGLSLPDKAFKLGLQSLTWPGRFQLVKRLPPVIVDGAHNPDAARALLQALRGLRFKGPVGMVAGFCDDKDLDAFLKPLAPRIRKGWAVTTPSPRSLAAEATAEHMRRMRIEAQAVDQLESALASAEFWAEKEQGLVLVCGSLFLAGVVLRHYQALPWQDKPNVPPQLNESLRAVESPEDR